MKKSLIALAALAASGFAMAQSSVTLFGVVDAAVTYAEGQNNVAGMTNGGLSSSRLGFRGVEDLGNGLKAGFWLEGGLSNDEGTGVGGGATGPGFEFKRRSTLSLMGNFGEVRLGRDLTAAYNAVSRYDNFGTIGIGGTRVWAQGGYGVRKDNMLAYLSPDFNGFKVNVNYAFGEQSDNTWERGAYYGVGLTYDNGPLSIGFGAERQNNTDVSATSTTTRLTAYGIGGSYDFGVVKLAAAYLNQDNQPHPTSLQSTDRDNYLLALSAPVGAAGVAKFSYNRYEAETGATTAKADQYSLGYVHNLSKRTAVYGTYSYLKNKNGATAVSLTNLAGTVGHDNGKQQAIQVGVRHAF